MTSTHCAEKTNADSRITDDIIETLKKNNDELNNDLIVLKKLVYMLVPPTPIILCTNNYYAGINYINEILKYFL